MLHARLLLAVFGALVFAHVPYARACQLEGSGATEYSEGDSALQAVGGLGASNLYLTYISIGSVYDNYVANVYDSQTSRNLVLSLQALITTSVEHIERVREVSALSSDDEEFLTAVIEIYGLLDKQSAFFLRYIKTGAAKEREKFQKERAVAWEKISRLLGIEK